MYALDDTIALQEVVTEDLSIVGILHYVRAMVPDP
jgi:hypothetical protein